MLVFEFIRHKIKAKGPHGVHSPFVFNLITRVLIPRERREVWKEVERIRHKFLANHETYVATDFGAGSRRLNRERKISDAVRTGAMSKKKGELLHLLAEHLAPSDLLELGTQFGVGTLYLTTAIPLDSTTYSIEGDPIHAMYAKQEFERFFNNPRVESIIGNFEDCLPLTLHKIRPGALAFIDGNHTKDATLRYFETLVQSGKFNCIVLDDIYWNSEMREAWFTIIGDYRVQLSLDLYWVGVVFLQGRMQKEHFQLKWPR